MNWDIRQGEKIPTFIRLMFVLMEDGETRTRKEVQEVVLPQMEDPVAESTVGTILNGLSAKGLLDSQSGTYMQPNRYTITEDGWKWWSTHQYEDWGYGEFWSAQVEAILESKMARAINSGKQVRIPLPCKKSIWNDVSVLAKTGKYEMVVRLKRDV